MIRYVIIRVSCCKHGQYLIIPTHFITSPDTIAIYKEWDQPLSLTEGLVSHYTWDISRIVYLHLQKLRADLAAVII